MTAQTSKGYIGIGMDGLIAKWYAGITLKNIEDFRKDARTIAGQVALGAAILELAPGPGYLAIELARLGSYRIAGLDISATFVEIAQQKAREAGVSIDFRQGDGAYIPFEGESFDFAVCRAAFKNFSQPGRVLDELYRVLKPGGKALILDLNAEASVESINDAVDQMGLNGLNAFMTRWTFRNVLLKRAYTQARFEELIARSPFKQHDIREDSISLEVWLEK